MSKWEKVKLSDIFDLQMGKTPSRNCKSYWDNGIYNWVSIADIGKTTKYIYETKEKITESAILESGIRLVPKGTIIMSFKLSLGKTCITGEDIYTNEAIMAFLDKHTYSIDKNYIYHLFSNYNWEQNTNKAVKGITLNKATLGKIKISLPPLEEQHKIASILDTVSEALKLRKQQSNELDVLVKSKFEEMFSNNEKIELYKLANISMGQSPISEYYNKTGHGLPFYQGKTEFGDIYIKNPSIWCTEPIKLANKGDVLISVRAPVGSVNIAIEKCCIGRGLAAITPIENKSTTMYLFYALKIMQSEIENMGVGSTFKAINKQQIFNLLLPKAKKEEQNTFVELAKHIYELKSEVQKSIDQLQTLFDSLMQQYFE